MSETKTLDEWFSNCTLTGQLGAILCWHFNRFPPTETDDKIPRLAGLIHAIELIPSLVSGETEEFTSDDWWVFCDALGSAGLPTGELGEIYQIAHDRFHSLLSVGPTKVFVLPDAEADGFTRP